MGCCGGSSGSVHMAGGPHLSSVWSVCASLLGFPELPPGCPAVEQAPDTLQQGLGPLGPLYLPLDLFFLLRVINSFLHSARPFHVRIAHLHIHFHKPWSLAHLRSPGTSLVRPVVAPSPARSESSVLEREAECVCDRLCVALSIVLSLTAA